MEALDTKTNRQRTKIVNRFVSRLDDLFDVAYLDVMKLLNLYNKNNRFSWAKEKKDVKSVWIEGSTLILWNNRQLLMKSWRSTKVTAIISPGLAAALNRARITDRNATYLLIAKIDTLKLDPNNYISRSAFRRSRISAAARSKIAG